MGIRGKEKPASLFGILKLYLALFLENQNQFLEFKSCFWFG